MMLMNPTSETYIPKDPDYAARVRRSFARQTALETIGATLEVVAPGRIEIHLPYDPRLTQQDGYLHAGIVTTIADTACGYAACTLTPADANVLTVEFKANFLSPARGDKFVATAQVLKAGRTLTICQGEVRAPTPSGPGTLVATMLATIIVLRPA
jgi:uncharacterized protein (TIGR00369 family)